VSDTLDARVDLIKGRYELLEVLGSGGEARVVKALDHMHARPVALKLRRVTEEARREDLLREAGVLLGLTPHPALPLVREDFFEDDQYVIVMDWVDGTDLAKLLRAKGKPGLEVASVLAYLAEAAEALTFLHTHDPPIIHGDVKPANLILTRGGRVKLVDFGLSSSPGGEGHGRGTLGFERRLRARRHGVCPPDWEDTDRGGVRGAGDRGRAGGDAPRGDPRRPGSRPLRAPRHARRTGRAPALGLGVDAPNRSDDVLHVRCRGLYATVGDPPRPDGAVAGPP
jgi:serine/threonine protein kinase